LEDLLAGKMALRIQNPSAELPLEMVYLSEQTSPGPLPEGPKGSAAETPLQHDGEPSQPTGETLASEEGPSPSQSD